MDLSIPSEYFTFDGKGYDILVTKCTRSFAKLSTDKSGRVQSGRMFIDLIGVYYNYNITVDASEQNMAEYDRFWEDISAPKPYVKVAFPYNQGVLTFDSYVTQGNQDLMRIIKNPKQFHGKMIRNLWGPTSLQFTSVEPQRRPL